MNLKPTLTLGVLIVDDHELTRCTLKLLLMHQPFIGMVTEASNGRQAIAQVQKYAPDLVLLDLQMPIVDGWTAARELRRLCPKTKIIAYSSMDCGQVAQLLADGVIDGFCNKDIGSDQLLELVRSLC
ncbi:MAG: response regulator transcription factor [Pseudanabaenaceae cyanobacterium]